MSKFAVHIFASNAKFNCGDFMIGKATKAYFAQVLLKIDPTSIKWTDMDCRNRNSFSITNIEALNKYDYIVVGAGGLILPDTNPNKISCWQWLIPKESYSKIVKPIYVVSIGYNLFYGQTINMPNRENNTSDSSRLPIFKANIEKLIQQSEHFSVRHTEDRLNLQKIVDPTFHSKIKFELCPTVWYCKKYWTPLIKQLNFPSNKKYLAIEIKDDRQWRRYGKIGKSRYYNELLKFVKYLIKNDQLVCCMIHDRSRSFYDFLKRNGINIPLIDNTVGNEKKIIDNFSKIHTVLCSAGHSQMMSYAVGIKTVSMISHPKLKNFCEDVKNNQYILINQQFDVYDALLKLCC